MQTRLPDELVVSDDHSIDATVAILNEFVARSPFPVRMEINNQTLGLTKNFERAISRCSGDVIFLSDQDDVWMPGKIELMAREFAKSDAIGLVFTDAELTDKSLTPLNDRLWNYSFAKTARRKTLPHEFYKTLLRGNVVTGAAMAFRSDRIAAFMPFPAHIPDFIHDGWIALAVSASSEIVYLETPLIKYRQHAAQDRGINREIETPVTMLEQLLKTLEYLRGHLIFLDQIRNHVNGNMPAQYAEKILESIAEIKLDMKDRITHLENRLSLSDKGTRRVPAIFSELKSGRYHRFSKGIRSAVKDLFATAKAAGEK